NIAGVLKTDSEPDTYAAVFGIYRGRAVAVIARLNALTVPRRLRPAHDRIKLHTAWDLIRRAYPDLAPAVLKPIEDHLCKFDVI
ncbi:MAG: hypothetical protein HYV94_14035, partial [Candidatus Rokubacteria bacterium]|nr:hypothetical protein [Candidatus Rokubacteria bacterium]